METRFLFYTPEDVEESEPPFEQRTYRRTQAPAPPNRGHVILFNSIPYQVLKVLVTYEKRRTLYMVIVQLDPEMAAMVPDDDEADEDTQVVDVEDDEDGDY